MIDIDHFKKYNDALGHLLGDVALRKVAAVLEKNLRRADIACRYGGEEFVVLLPESDSSHAVMAAEKLRQAILKVDFEGEDKMPDGVVSVSIGVAAYPEHGEDAGELLHHADKGLYEAKRGGRNRVVLLDDEETESA
jgi:diguanylate cyclase (GGDEF)-like protein